jgi:hypothetical protein
MKADLDTITYKLGLSLCFILVAFISYYLDRNSQSSPPDNFANFLARADPEILRREDKFLSLNSTVRTPGHEQERSLARNVAQEQLRKDVTGGTSPGNGSSSTISDYDRGFHDGMATSFKLKVHDISKAPVTGTRNPTEKERVKEKLEELDKQEKTRQRIFQANMIEMKKWREEQLRAIWEQKQAKERSFMGWLRKDPVSSDSVRVFEPVKRGGLVAGKET